MFKNFWFFCAFLRFTFRKVFDFGRTKKRRERKAELDIRAIGDSATIRVPFLKIELKSPKTEKKLDKMKNIDLIELYGKSVKPDAPDTIYILKFFWLRKWQVRIKELFGKSVANKAVVIGINVNSFNPDETFQKGVTVVDSLIKNGIKPQNIVLEGNCVNGAVATMIAKHFYDKKQTLNVFNDRSFSDSHHLISKRMMDNCLRFDFLSKGFIKGFIYPLESIAQRNNNGRVVAGDVFAKLHSENPDRFEYTVFRPQKRGVFGKTQEDELISYNNSIHMALAGYRRKIKLPLKESIEEIMRCIESDLKNSGIILKLQNQLEKYRSIIQESDLKEVNIALFDEAIRNVAGGNFVIATQKLREAVTRVNSRHKVELLYKDATGLRHNMDGRFLYCRGLHSTVVTNDNSSTLRIKPEIMSDNKIKSFKGKDVDIKDSMYSRFVENIKKINQEEPRI